ncbi:metallophosphoesterase [Paenibacillus tengchongensis]|uniref:metallophosphoesterase n=1 Tax=Paenibacillus tengchongensis TaxID=2608684 RepID=UPI0016522DF9|nr:metallophosphoesterase [Paenibacillus tengchongensis]
MVSTIIGIVVLIVLAGAVFLALMVVKAFATDIIAEEITLSGLPPAFDGFRILLITDIHRRRLPQAKLSHLKGNVDAVFLGGDMSEKGNPLTRLIANMAFAASLAPVYAVHGNHDYKAGITLVDNVLRGYGIDLLQDENRVLRRGSDQLALTGVDFPRTGGTKAYAPLPGLPADLFRIILVHDPLWLSTQDTVPADLILAGHTHGGQVVLPLLGRRHVEPFYREYSAGTYFIPRTEGAEPSVPLLISRGYGTSHLPLRWGSPAELHVLTLRRSAESTR